MLFIYARCLVSHWQIRLAKSADRMRVVLFVKCVRPLTRHRYCTKPYSRGSCFLAQECETTTLNSSGAQAAWQRVQVKTRTHLLWLWLVST